MAKATGHCGKAAIVGANGYFTSLGIYTYKRLAVVYAVKEIASINQVTCDSSVDVTAFNLACSATAPKDRNYDKSRTLLTEAMKTLHSRKLNPVSLINEKTSERVQSVAYYRAIALSKSWQCSKADSDGNAVCSEDTAWVPTETITSCSSSKDNQTTCPGNDKDIKPAALKDAHSKTLSQIVVALGLDESGVECREAVIAKPSGDLTADEVSKLWNATDKSAIEATNYAANTSVGAWVYGNAGSVVVCNKNKLPHWGAHCDAVPANQIATSNGARTRAFGLVSVAAALGLMA
eukprot:GHVU01074526.1.p1 GENE.GHVU01074526.1~~GHVU01074526.1.p1  ORF type:complete len:309 (-),score=53.84 GHVU01074526.1:564-1439(-)